MSGKKMCGMALVAGMLFAGAALAGENPGQGTASRKSEQAVMGNNTVVAAEMTVAAAERAVEEKPAPGAERSSRSDVYENGDVQGNGVEEVKIADPIEPVNRAVFKFNDKFYFWVLKPVAQGYGAVVPEPGRVSVRNLFLNAKMPVRFVNSLFQGKFRGAGTELARFGINTMIGLGGFFDVAKDKFDLDPSDEDFGQTLGFYGLGGGMYIVWPFLGPSTLRDSVGMAGDSALNPVSYIPPFGVPIGLKAFEIVNKTSLDINAYDDLIAASVEPYTGVRDAYIQFRKNQIAK